MEFGEGVSGSNGVCFDAGDTSDVSARGMGASAGGNDVDEVVCFVPEEGYDVSGEELFRRFLDGDVYAFEVIVALYEDELSRFIFTIVNDYHDTKHLTIESFGQLAVSSRRFAGKSSLKTYLFAIGKNLAYRHLKVRRKHKCVSFEEVADAFHAGHETPQGHIEREENKQLIHSAMSELKDEHNTVLTLLYMEDMSYREIAEAMKKSEEQVKHLAHRARAALKKKLEQRELHMV